MNAAGIFSANGGRKRLAAALMVALFAVAFLGERPAPRDWVGITLVALGVVFLALKR